MMRIDGGHFVLRTMVPGDRDGIVRHGNDHKVWVNLTNLFPHPYTLRDADDWIALAGHPDAESGTVHLGIEVDGEVAGCIGFVPARDVHLRTALLGYWLGTEHWGKGIMTRAVGLFRPVLFSEERTVRASADIFGWNPASGRVLEKNGFEREGFRRGHVTKDGRVTDLLLYGLLKEDWLRRKDTA